MKKISLLLFLLTLTVSISAQKNLEEKLLEVFPKEKVNTILGNNQLKEYYTTVLFNSYKIEKVDTKKFSQLSYPSLSNVTIKDKNKNNTVLSGEEVIKKILSDNFNILLTDLDRKTNSRLSYKVEGTNYILTIYSYKELKK